MCQEHTGLSEQKQLTHRNHEPRFCSFLVTLDSLVVQEKMHLHTLWLPFRMHAY